MDMPEPAAAAAAFSALRAELGQCILGQQALTDRLLVTLHDGREFRAKLVQLLEKEAGDETYQLGIQLFPLTRASSGQEESAT